MLSRTLINLKWMSIAGNSLYNLLRSKAFSSYGFVVPSLNVNGSYINQNPIFNVEVSGGINTKVTSFVVDSLDDVMYIVVHWSHSIQPFLCDR